MSDTPREDARCAVITVVGQPCGIRKGDHYGYDHEWAETPDHDDVPDPNRRGMPKCRCGDIAYRPDPVAGRLQAWRCGGCHRTLARCNCPALGAEVEPPDPLATYVPSRDEAGYLVSKAQRAESEAIAALRRNIDNLPAHTRAGWERWVQPDTKTYLLAEAVYAAVDAALGAEAETPDPRCDFDCDACRAEDDKSGHWVDLASPETAEALATAVGRTRRVAMSDDEYAAAILAAWRETGR